jgi:hypothetical protein
MSTPGWYDDGSGRQRWWNGQQWTEHYAPSSQAIAAYSATAGPEVSRARLAHEIAGYVRSGWRVEAQADSYAVVVFGNRPNHILHLILTLVTFGLWVIVWILVAVTSGEKRRTLQIDGYGNVITT